MRVFKRPAAAVPHRTYGTKKPLKQFERFMELVIRFEHYLVITNDVLYLLSYTSVASLRNVLYYNSLCGQLQPLFLKIIIYFNFPVDLIFRLPVHRIRPERLPPPFQLPIDASAKLYHSEC